MKNIISRTLYLFLISFTLLLVSCESSDEADPVNEGVSADVNSCVGCHTNYDHLKEVYTPETADDGGAGCGGEVPHYEPYDRVYMGGAGYDDFKNDSHGKLDCVKCHNGVDNTADKNVAHSGNFISHPSKVAEEKCATCHIDIVARTENSIHNNGWGQKSMVSLRHSGVDGPEGFNNLPEELKAGYDVNCAKCHGSCGDCHVMRPVQGGGGLMSGHKFTKTPDMVNTCVTCHVSRGGHAYLGVAQGTVPDVHLTKAGFKCMDCHSVDEVHGDGNYYNQRYSMKMIPQCEDCHADPKLAENKFHNKHIEDFNCQVCHSQDYNNCGSCHIHGEGARVPSHQKFKIGMNPLKETSKPQYKMALLRQSLTAPDSWKEYGVENLDNFSIRPTYKYTTPHNIQKITSRTGYKNTEGNWTLNLNCTEGCHIYQSGDTLKNKHLYLFEEDLESWEIEANKGIIVDGKLPSWWNVN